MQDEPDSLVLRYLRIDAQVDGLREDMREGKTRLGLFEQQDATSPSRIEARPDRIEKRLDLVEE